MSAFKLFLGIVVTAMGVAVMRYELIPGMIQMLAGAFLTTVVILKMVRTR